MDSKRYLIMSPYCGRDKRGAFVCRCGGCHEISGKANDRYGYPLDAVVTLWQPTDSCYIELSGSHGKEDEEHGED